MATMKNSIQLIGNLGQDPQITVTSSGAKVGRVSLATHEFYTDKSGEKVKQTHWHNIVAWGDLADFMERELKKGAYIGVRGKLRYQKFTNKEGQDQVRTKIQVQEFLEAEKEVASSPE